MLSVSKRVEIDLLNRGLPPHVNMSQGDDMSRELQFSLYAGSEPLQIPSSTRVLIEYRRSDGKGGIYDTLPNGSQAYSISGETVTISIVSAVTFSAGQTWITIFLRDGPRNLSSFPVIIDVAGIPGYSDDGSGDEYLNIKNFVKATGWEPSKLLGTDIAGKVVALDNPKTISGNIPPTTSTKGMVGQLYLDTKSKVLYKCDAVSGSTYTWSPVFNGGDISAPLYLNDTRIDFNDRSENLVFSISSNVADGKKILELLTVSGTNVSIKGVADPVDAVEAANKRYVDQQIAALRAEIAGSKNTQ